MINHITRFTKGSRVDIKVYYKGGKTRSFRENDNLPKTVWEILINGTCETKYTNTGKVEHFR